MSGRKYSRRDRHSSNSAIAGIGLEVLVSRVEMGTGNLVGVVVRTLLLHAVIVAESCFVEVGVELRFFPA